VQAKSGQEHQGGKNEPAGAIEAETEVCTRRINRVFPISAFSGPAIRANFQTPDINANGGVLTAD
jgi:hypothetical protein